MVFDKSKKSWSNCSLEYEHFISSTIFNWTFLETKYCRSHGVVQNTANESNQILKGVSRTKQNYESVKLSSYNSKIAMTFVSIQYMLKYTFKTRHALIFAD